MDNYGYVQYCELEKKNFFFLICCYRIEIDRFRILLEEDLSDYLLGRNFLFCESNSVDMEEIVFGCSLNVGFFDEYIYWQEVYFESFQRSLFFQRSFYIFIFCLSC